MNNEEILIKKCKKGDLDAFETLIKNHQKRAYNIALKMLKNPEDAMDISQEAFIKVFKYIDSYNNKSSFSTWIYRIVINTCLDYIKKNKNNVLYLDEPINTDDGSIKREITDNKNNPEKILEKKINNEDINKAISMLKVKHRMIIILRDIQGFSYEEISKMLNLPLGTVKSRVKRARENLRKIILEKVEQN